LLFCQYAISGRRDAHPLGEEPAKGLAIGKTKYISHIGYGRIAAGQKGTRLIDPLLLYILMRRIAIRASEQPQKMIFGKTGLGRQQVQRKLLSFTGMNKIHGPRQLLIKLYTCGQPHRRKPAYEVGNMTMLLHMIGQQGCELFFKQQLVEPILCVRTDDLINKNVKDAIPPMQLIEKGKIDSPSFYSLIQYPVGRRDQGMKNFIGEMLSKVNIEGLGRRTLLYLQRIGLRFIGHKIGTCPYTGGPAIYRAETAAPEIQKEGKRPLYIGAKTFPADGMNDDAGKPIRIQTMISPPRSVVPSPGDLAFQPGNVREFMKDHIRLKIQKAPGTPRGRFIQRPTV